jgi:hypothetical protein
LKTPVALSPADLLIGRLSKITVLVRPQRELTDGRIPEYVWVNFTDAIEAELRHHLIHFSLDYVRCLVKVNRAGLGLSGSGGT